MLTPEDLRYSSDHEWIKVEDDNQVRIGITDYAQDALGDVVFVELPLVDTATTAGVSIGEVESTKSVSDIYSPVTGMVVQVNDDLANEPEKMNSDPYGEGWLCIIRLDSASELDDLMNAQAYLELTEG